MDLFITILVVVAGYQAIKLLYVSELMIDELKKESKGD